MTDVQVPHFAFPFSLSRDVPNAINLVPNPSFEYDTVGSTPADWAGLIAGTGTLTTFARQSGWAKFGSGSARATVTGVANGSYGQFNTPAGDGSPPVTPDAVYSFGMWVNVLSATNMTVSLNIFWLRPDGTFISQVDSAPVSALGVSQITLLNQSAPEGAAYGQVAVTLNSSSAGGAMDVYFDGFQVAPGAVLPTYFDGDTPNYTWSGTPGNSASATITGAVDAVEQDTLDEVFACVQTVVACPIGGWGDEPTFGIPSPLFARAPIDPTGIQGAIAQWEPRSTTAATEYPDAFNDAIRTVALTVSTAQADQ